MAMTTNTMDAETQETWEVTVAGGVVVWKRNRRTGDYEHAKAHGTKGPKLLRLTADDREYNQELVPDESKHLDPFTNGRLLRVEGSKRIGITDESLHALLDLSDIEVFEEGLADITSNELSLRRLLDMAETDGTLAQRDAVKRLIDEHYKVGGTQPTMMEIYDEEAAGV